MDGLRRVDLGGELLCFWLSKARVAVFKAMN